MEPRWTLWPQCRFVLAWFSSAYYCFFVDYHPFFAKNHLQHFQISWLDIPLVHSLVLHVPAMVYRIQSGELRQPRQNLNFLIFQELLEFPCSMSKKIVVYKKNIMKCFPPFGTIFSSKKSWCEAVSTFQVRKTRHSFAPIVETWTHPSSWARSQPR